MFSKKKFNEDQTKRSAVPTNGPLGVSGAPPAPVAPPTMAPHGSPPGGQKSQHTPRSANCVYYDHLNLCGGGSELLMQINMAPFIILALAS